MPFVFLELSWATDMCGCTEFLLNKHFLCYIFVYHYSPHCFDNAPEFDLIDLT